LSNDRRRVFRDRLEPFQIIAKQLVLANTVLEALQVPLQFETALFRQPVDAPVLMLQGFDEPVLFQVTQMLGNLNLRFPKDRLEVANAKRCLRQQVQEPQPGLVTKAFVYARIKFTNTLYTRKGIYRKKKVCAQMAVKILEYLRTRRRNYLRTLPALPERHKGVTLDIVDPARRGFQERCYKGK
jgi:hypothetical protein